MERCPTCQREVPVSVGTDGPEFICYDCQITWPSYRANLSVSTGSAMSVLASTRNRIVR